MSVMQAAFSIRIPSGSRFAREPRYTCRECCDSGWVSIFDPRVVRQATIDPDAVKHWLTVMVLCGCDSAEEHKGKFTAGPRAGNYLPVFGEKAWHFNSRSQTAKADAAAYVHKSANYNEALAGVGQS